MPHHDDFDNLLGSSESHLASDPRDLADPQVFGRLFFDNVYKILKVGSIYDIDHNQTRIAIDEFLEFFRESMARSQEASFAILVRDELAIVNGVTLRLDRQAQKRHNEMRDLFGAAKIRGMDLSRQMRSEDFQSMLRHLRLAAQEGQGMEHVKLAGIDLAHGAPIRNIVQAISQVNKAMYTMHVYIRGLVKVRNMHTQVRDKQSPEVPMGVIKRILQTISELLGDDDFTILGLLPMRLVEPDLSSHSFNTSIYAMLLGDRLGLDANLTTYMGMAALYQDVDRLLGIAVSHRDRETILNLQNQFQANLRDVARMISQLDGDLISTLRTLLTYERGCPLEADISKPFYRGSRSLHLVTRILDICRTYDALIQGLEGYKARRPDLALQYLESRADEAFEGALVDLLISTIGLYPIGSSVELSTGERAIVIRTPSASVHPSRPVVKLLSGQSSRVMDLGDARHAHVDIVRTVDTKVGDFATSRVFLLT